jgi:hypothetical protein
MLLKVANLLKFFLLCAALLPAAVLADNVAAQAELERSVAQSSHIVIGTATDVAVVSLYNGLLYRLNPEPAQLTSYTAAQLQLEVNEVLYPPGWQPIGTIKYLFGGGLLPLAQIKSDTLNKRMIYLLRAQDDNKIRDNSPLFYAGSDAHLAVSMQSVERVRKLLAKRAGIGTAAAAPTDAPKR